MEVVKIKSPVSWMGNKSPILPVLYGHFPLEYERYIEPFGGSGSVLLGKPWTDRFEVFNDYNYYRPRGMSPHSPAYTKQSHPHG